MSQPGTVSRTVLATLWLVLGAVMVAVPVWLGWTRWSVLLNGHPALLVLGLLCAMAGLVAVAWSVATLLLGARYDRETAWGEAGHRTPAQLRRRAKRRIGLAVPALMLSVLTVGVVAWARPFAATDVALAAMRSTGGVRVADRLTWFEMQSTRTNAAGHEIRPTTGLVFSPGARVDARAYANLLRPLAASGYLVVVLKEPLGVALVQGGQAATPIRVHPEIRRWAVGGHSLGGVAAASFADSHPQVKGLLLYGSYPARTLQRKDLTVLSISGTCDGLATPADIADARPRLPATTRYVAVRGSIHAFFGDYGAQPGDGQPTVPRSVAQAQIRSATQSLLASLTPPVKKKVR